MSQPRLRAAPRRAAVYARSATNNPGDGSIENQVRICRTRAEREGWVIAEIFTDRGTSGLTTLRPGYQALMSAIRSGLIDVVVAASLDRLSRDQGHLADVYQLAQVAGVRIITLSEGEISAPAGGLKATLEALYLKEVADTTRRVARGRAHEGRYGGGLG